jgi:hypothetical protein
MTKLFDVHFMLDTDSTMFVILDLKTPRRRDTLKYMTSDLVGWRSVTYDSTVVHRFVVNGLSVREDIQMMDTTTVAGAGSVYDPIQPLCTRENPF